VIDCRIVSITASSIFNLQCRPLRRVVDCEDQNFFCTTNEANSWICHDFKDLLIKLIHSSIHSGFDSNDKHLDLRTLEGSTDSFNWMGFEDRKNDTSLSSKGAISRFSISSESQKQFQMIHLRQIRKNGTNTDNLVTNAMKFFEVSKELKQ
jgi:hypothetical protein